MALLRRCLSTTPSLRRTALYDFNVQHGGKMVDFAGWSMPVQYSGLGVLPSCIHTRTNASIFDVSHMQQLRIHGKDRIPFIQKLIVGSVKALKQDQTRYSIITNERGGIIDDCVVTRREDHLYMVVNAGRAHVDIPHFQQHLDEFTAQGNEASIEIIPADQDSLIAFQGPKAAEVLGRYVGMDLNTLKFFYVADLEIDGVPCQVSRSGYTGEDGFEISVPSQDVSRICEMLLENSEVELAGLAARDALRLEAGLSLYGHDLDEDTTPVEADLMFTIGKKRRREGGFLGAEVIQRQLKEGVSRKRVGLLVTGAPAREGASIEVDGKEVGKITSGTYSPTLKRPVAMGYVPPEYSALDTELSVDVRGRKQKAVVSAVPFVPNQYFKSPK